MKHFCIILFMFCAMQLMADTGKSLSPKQGDWSLAGGYSLGGAYVWVLEKDIPDWHSGLFCSSGFVYGYYFKDKVELQSGLRYDQYQSQGLVLHPQTYMLDSKLDLTIHAVRVPLIINRDVLSVLGVQIWYLGAGGYVDLLTEAKLDISDRYPSQLFLRSRSALDDMGVLYPGIQFHIGSKTKHSRLEMCYWVDAKKYSLAESGSAEYRRSGVSLNYSYSFIRNRH